MAKTKQKKRQAKIRQLRKKSRPKHGNGRRRSSSGRGVSGGGVSRLPLQDCIVNSNWREQGFALVYLNRRRRNVLLGAGFYVDLWGIGLKDCFPTQDVPIRAFMDYSEQIGPMEECDEELARQLVWGGWWRAHEEGFRPPREFASCRGMLAPLEQEEVDRTLFGKDGETLIVGDYEDLARRSTRPLDFDQEERRFIIGPDELPDGLALEDDPWQELFVEDDVGFDLPPDKELVLFIDATFYGESFEALYQALSAWDDLHVEELDKEAETARLIWTRPYPRNHWNPMSQMPAAGQILGEIDICQGSLTVHVRGKSWMLIMMERLSGETDLELTRGPLKITDPAEVWNVG